MLLLQRTDYLHQINFITPPSTRISQTRRLNPAAVMNEAVGLCGEAKASARRHSGGDCGDPRSVVFSCPPRKAKPNRGFFFRLHAASHDTGRHVGGSSVGLGAELQLE